MHRHIKAGLTSSAIFILLIVFSFYSTTANAQEDALTRYEFGSAYAEKTSTTETGNIKIEKFEKIYIIDGGKKEAHYITEKRDIPMLNKVEESRSVTIIDGKWLITYNPDTNEGTKMENKFTDTFSGMSKEDMEKFGKQMADALKTDVTEVGTKEVAGKTCKVTKAVTDMMGMKTATTTASYKGFGMEVNSSGVGTKVYELVTKFEEGATIDPEKLKVPSTVNIKEVKSPF